MFWMKIQNKMYGYLSTLQRHSSISADVQADLSLTTHVIL